MRKLAFVDWILLLNRLQFQFKNIRDHREKYDLKALYLSGDFEGLTKPFHVWNDMVPILELFPEKYFEKSDPIVKGNAATLVYEDRRVGLRSDLW